MDGKGALMDPNDVRAIIHAYSWICKSLRDAGYKEVPLEDLVKAVIDVINNHPDLVYRGPDLNFTIAP